MRAVEASKFVAMLIAAYPNSQVNEATSRLYESMLADQDADATGKAIARLIGSCRFLPTIAEIRSTIADLQFGPVRPGGEAWGDVIQAIRRVGHMGTPKFADPIVADIVRGWGWRQLCCEGDDVADRSQFVRLYDALATQRRTDVATGIPLPRPEQRPELPARPRQDAPGLPSASEVVLRVTDATRALRVPAAPMTPAKQYPRRMTAEELDKALGSGGTP